MKFKNGREMKPGDYVIGPVEDKLVAGKIHELTGKAVLLYPVEGRTIFQPIEPAEFFHANDAMEAAELCDVLRAQNKELSQQNLRLAGELAAALIKAEEQVPPNPAAAAWGGAVAVPIRKENPPVIDVEATPAPAVVVETPAAPIAPPGIFPNSNAS